MSRSSIHEALVLKVRSYGESNREASFLTEDEGILRAVVFGGPKSRLRAHVAPFHRGTLYLYRDPVKNSSKVTDFDVRSWRPLLREQLDRGLAAQAVLETIHESHGGGGDWKSALHLADETLEALELADERTSSLTFLRFMWKWAGFLGSRPELQFCSSCDCCLAPDAIVWYFRREERALCGPCAERAAHSDSGSWLLIPAGTRRWLKAVDGVSAREALRIGLDAKAAAEGRRFVSGVLAETLGRHLTCWDPGSQ